MRKLAAWAVVLGLVAASCSGHSAGTALPSTRGADRAASTIGTHPSRPKASITAPAGWATTGTSALALANAADLGQLDRTKTVEVTLGLQMRNVEAAKSAIAARQIMSRDAFVAGFAPSADQVAG